MKNILIVADSEENTKCMLEKALRFSPDFIRVVHFETSKSSVANIQSVLQSATKDKCQAEMVISAGNSIKEKTLALTSIIEQIKPDMTVVHRPQAGKEQQDFTLIKGVLKTPSSSKILLSGDHAWQSKIKALATLDISDNSSVQKSLNGRVIDYANKIAEAMQAEIAFLSVLPISTISKELVLTSPSEIMANKGKATKEKLDKTVKEQATSLTYKSYVSAGKPSVEIATISRKLNASLVLIGNVGRTGIKGLIVGNTAERILNRLTVDALIMK